MRRPTRTSADTRLAALIAALEPKAAATTNGEQVDNDFLSALALTSIGISLRRLTDRYCPPINGGLTPPQSSDILDESQQGEDQ